MDTSYHHIITLISEFERSHPVKSVSTKYEVSTEYSTEITRVCQTLGMNRKP
jgi:hypothetical protein